MKRKIIGVLLCFALVAVLSGCAGSNEKDMKRYMDSVALEYEGYYFSNEYEEGSAKVVGIQLPATVNLRGETLYIDNLETEEQGFDGYSVRINDQIIDITIDYFKSQSSAFNKILKMWDRYIDSERNPQKINVGPLFVFDDELFICASYTPPSLWADWKGKIPLTMYHFVTEDYSLRYAGYSDSYIFSGYICKNK